MSTGYTPPGISIYDPRRFGAIIMTKDLFRALFSLLYLSLFTHFFSPKHQLLAKNFKNIFFKIIQIRWYVQTLLVFLPYMPSICLCSPSPLQAFCPIEYKKGAAENLRPHEHKDKSCQALSPYTSTFI